MRRVHHRMAALAAAVALSIGALGAGQATVQSAEGTSPAAVIDWSVISQNAVIVGRPTGSAFYLHAIVLLALHDAVNAIEGGSSPLVSLPPVTRPADLSAAVATAAHDVLVVRVPGQAANVQALYDAYLAGIPDGAAKDNGIAVGQAAAAAVLADRADDNFDVDPPYVQPTPGPGVFEPVAATKPVDIKLGNVRPIAIPDADAFMPGPPIDMSSDEYAADFDEVKALGRKTGSTRTPEQTETAMFWSESGVITFTRMINRLAVEHGLDATETARLFAMAFVPSADSLIVCLRAKYHYMFWRPIHAIQRADTDANPATQSDTEWAPLLVVNHPEYPSGHSCGTGALLPAVHAFFGTDRLDVTVSSSVTGTSRTFSSLRAIGRDVFMARIYSGLHFRFSMGVGFNLAKQVARDVLANYFGE
jgi:hypothetical protein